MKTKEYSEKYYDYFTTIITLSAMFHSGILKPSRLVSILKDIKRAVKANHNYLLSENDLERLLYIIDYTIDNAEGWNKELSKRKKNMMKYKLMDSDDKNEKSKLCIDDFGVIMHDALNSALTQDDDVPCVYLDGDDYTDEDFERFLKDVEKVQKVDSCVIDGYA